jgi:hypothetical protein
VAPAPAPSVAPVLTPNVSAPIVFISPADAQLDASLRDAVTAQLSGAQTPVVFGRLTRDDGRLEDQVEQAKAFSIAHHALGVFWVDARMADDWLVYLLADRSGGRIFVRHIRVERDGVAAATEAVAVIIRESSEGLRTGQATGMKPVALTPAVEPSPFEPPKKVTPPPPSPPPLGKYQGASVVVGYHGDQVSPGVGWQSGAHVSLQYRDRTGFYGGLGYTFLRDADVTTADLTFQLQRSPFDVALGFAVPFGRFVPAFEVRGVLEAVSRSAVSTSASLQATPGETRFLAYLGPRARFDLALSRTISLSLAVGADFALSRFSFISRDDRGDIPLLEPSVVRPVVEAGVALWP